MHRVGLFIAALLFASCAGSKQTPRADSNQKSSRTVVASGMISRDSAIAIMRRLETDPLAAGATMDRQYAFEWLASSDEMKGIAIDGRYLQPLEESDYPFAGELLMQFAFGMALHRLSAESAASDHASDVEAGLRSVIATYRNMVQLDVNLSDKFLDDLDEIRRLGRLRAYIEKVDENG
ncbi:MAG: hypothetical protein H7X80_01030 [bacterium]|nr:hypothetical protein [Candidatus Kapabacteria bacterium]